MKKTILSIFLCFVAFGCDAQFAASVHPVVGYNTSAFFKDFREYYNTVNAPSLKNKLGNPALFYGYSINLGYRVTHLASSVTRDYLFAKTHATFTNNAKRIIEYEYKLTTANIGYFQPGENGEFTIEIGMLHAVVNQYSFLKLPNNEIDFFHGGVSADNTWVNLGMDAKITYLKPLGEKWLFHFQATGIYLKNEKDIAPFITLDGHRASLSLIGISAGAGLTFKFGEYYE